jgi:hypothetical protein
MCPLRQNGKERAWKNWFAGSMWTLVSLQCLSISLILHMKTDSMNDQLIKRFLWISSYSIDFCRWPANQKISMNEQLIQRFPWMTTYSKYLHKLNCCASSSHTIIQDTTPLTASVIKQILILIYVPLSLPKISQQDWDTRKEIHSILPAQHINKHHHH